MLLHNTNQLWREFEQKPKERSVTYQHAMNVKKKRDSSYPSNIISFCNAPNSDLHISVTNNKL